MNTSPQDGPNKLDFSEAAARRAALSETIQHPLTLIPLAVGGVAATGLALFASGSGAAVAAIAGVAIAGLNWSVRFFRGGDAYMRKHFAQLHEEFERIKEEKSAQLASDLKKLKCKQGQLQVRQLAEKFENLVEVFRRVLSENELTYSRFVGTAEQGYRAGLENLERIVVLLMNTDDIDREEVGTRIETYEKAQLLRKLKASEERNLSALKKQALVHDQSTQEVEDLLAANEEALAAMDQAGAAALRIKDRSSSLTPKESMDESLELLNQMIARANKKREPAITLDQPGAQTT
ncbi:MAG: hypothetical protein AAB365_00185 [Patescibacteria group bacterium]